MKIDWIDKCAVSITDDMMTWRFEIYHPKFGKSDKYGFRILWDLLILRFDPKNKAYGFGLFGLGFGFIYRGAAAEKESPA